MSHPNQFDLMAQKNTGGDDEGKEKWSTCNKLATGFSVRAGLTKQEVAGQSSTICPQGFLSLLTHPSCGHTHAKYML